MYLSGWTLFEYLLRSLKVTPKNGQEHFIMLRVLLQIWNMLSNPLFFIVFSISTIKVV